MHHICRTRAALRRLSRFLGCGAAAACLISSHSVLADEVTKMDKECYEVVHSTEPQDAQRLKECRRQFFNSEQVMLVVTPSRRPESVREAAASVSVVTRQELERTASDSPAEAMREVPGVQITDAGEPGLKRIRIRGEESRRVAILIDGQEFADERDVGTPLLLAPEMIERIEVVRGTGSVLHGSRAIGGVVNFITKKGGYHPVQGTASAMYDSSTNGHQEFASIYGGVEGYEYRVAGAIADHSDREAADGEQENTSYENESYLAFLSKTWGKHTLAFSHEDFNASSDVYVDPVVATTPPFNDFRIDAPQRDRAKTAVFYDARGLSESLESLHFDAYYQESEREFNTFSDLTLNFGAGPVNQISQVFSDSTLDTVGSNGLAGFQLGSDHNLIVGYEVKRDSLDQSRRRLVSVDGAAAPEELVVEEASQTSTEAFIEDAWRFAEDWQARAGLRGILIDSELESSTREGLEPNSTTDEHAVGAASISYTGLEDSTIWAGWSQGYVAPSLVNLATGAFAGPDFVSPNSELEPETSNSVDIGARRLTDDYQADITFFLTEARNYIDHVLCTESSAPCISSAGRRGRVYDNVDEARTFGAELSVSLFLDEFTPYLRGSWLRRRFDDGLERTYDTGIPDLSGRGGLIYERAVSDDLALWADGYVAAASDARERDGEEVLKTAGWATTNLALGAAIGEGRDLKLSLELLNLGDKFYRTSTENIPARGRSALVKLTVDL